MILLLLLLLQIVCLLLLLLLLSLLLLCDAEMWRVQLWLHTRSAIHVSCMLQGENGSLRKSLQSFRKSCAERRETPGARNSLL